MNTTDPAQLLAGIRIVLVSTSHPGNIGAAARAMKTMGLKKLVLVTPKSFPDPVADARATGALDILESADVCATLEQALAGTTHAVALSARRRELSHEVRPAREAAVELVRMATEGKGTGGEVALVFGTELSGLSNAEASLCQEFVMIPTNPDYSSLNLGAAVQVMAYELRVAAFGGNAPLPTKRQGEPDNEGESAVVPTAARFEDIEHFYQHLEQVMLGTGFLDPANPKRLMPRLRRLFARADLEKEEVNILRGFLTSLTTPKYRPPK